MNERVLELAEQVGWGEGNILMYEEDMLKFAELIVRECTNHVNQYINDCGEVASLPDYVLESHFGIEE